MYVVGMDKDNHIPYWLLKDLHLLQGLDKATLSKQKDYQLGNRCGVYLYGADYSHLEEGYIQ